LDLIVSLLRFCVVEKDALAIVTFPVQPAGLDKGYESIAVFLAGFLAGRCDSA
jgi:hypothetical protein